MGILSRLFEMFSINIVRESVGISAFYSEEEKKRQ